MPRRELPAFSRPRLEVGRALARAVSVLLALVGVIPFAATLALRSELLRERVATETAALLERTLGLAASYEVAVELFPLEVVVRHLRVESSDGGGPALTADRIAITPRLFALLGGRLDAGDVEVEGSMARLVVRDGQLTNVAYRLPATGDSAPAPLPERAPFSTVARTDV
ncbi:MAG: hypothetical protein FJ104_09895, partial [Deltaproteobacteria bacterium]|nr:hypothetical protein [Deltaproteobacteria bacterium]